MILAGRYELLRQVGRGGMGQVWESRDLVLGRVVAVKTVHLEPPDEGTLAARFRREAVATAALSHPNIVTVHDAGTDGPTAYLVMEFVSGRNLEQLLHERGALPLDEALRIAADVAAALAAAHAIGVVHRDIKPGNVLLDGSSVKVVDFGIAALTQSAQTALTAPGSTLGTAEYMAPEQATAGNVTPAADIYALGCLLTALLMGRPPFTGEHPLAVLRQQVDDEPPPLSAARDDIPHALETLIGGLLAKDPAARPDAPTVQVELSRLPDAGRRPVLPPAAEAIAKHGGREATTAALPASPATRPLRVCPPAPGATSPRTSDVPAPAAAQASADSAAGSPTASPTARRRRRAGPVLAATAVLALVAVGLGLANRDPAAVTGAAATSPSATTAATPSPASAPPAGPVPLTVPQALDALRLVLAALETNDGKDSVRRDLLKRWEDLAEAVEDGTDGKVGSRLRELDRRFSSQVDDGAISAERAEPVRAALDALYAARADAAPAPAAVDGGHD